ncbi:MFS transporter [Pseudoxanthomonas indica]|uniref:Predicted arabinose efflux permease, MFS family n=1 Tax=Pseudoxanthomonas indica TaxID=428993 RepID=A0A1T5KEG8_9GAMM|nr:MFS transporter [Pseudoxanthomonas indica]GGD48766.1 MFS transporter [Pseudoxanthomonas indica]SKC61929.1 Predicted arabinose efflux permease, MFS family [Pseudoxanthomonas indica]
MNIPNRITPAWSNWLLAVAYVCLVFSFQSAYAILSRSMAQALGLSVGDVGLIGSTYTWVFAAAQVAAGPLLDRVGAQRSLPAACTLFVLGVFLFGFAEDLRGLLLSQVLLATGAAFGFIGAGFVGGLWFSPERYGPMFAWVQFMASLTAFLAQGMAAMLTGLLPWNWIVNGVGMCGLGLVLLFLFFLRDPPGTQTRGWPRRPLQFLGSVTDDVITTLACRGVLALMLVGAASFGVMLAIGVVWGPRLGESLGLSSTASSLSASCWLGLAVGAPLFARWSQRSRTPVRQLRLGVLAQLLLLGWIVFLPAASVECFTLQMFLLGLASGAAMLPFTLATARAGQRYAGTAAALVNGAQFIAGGILIALPGQLLRIWGDQLSVRHALMALPLVLVAALPAFPFLLRVQASSPARPLLESD